MLEEIVEPLLSWYQENKRELPWRADPTPYHVWVSEIMLQQTRVEAVKGYYARFLEALPRIEDLARCPQEKLLKLWEGLGYYNRVKNMQKAALEIVEQYSGEIPEDYEKILGLPGIGSYTAGAIASIAYKIPKPAVDGNVLRVIARITEEPEDILKQRTRKKIEDMLEKIMPARCQSCPVNEFCLAKAHEKVVEYPRKAPKKARRIEEKTVLILQNGQEYAIHKRPAGGLLGGLYELPNLEGYHSREEILAYVESLGLIPLHISGAGEAKHIFSHVEWRMKGYFIKVASTEEKKIGELIFADKKESRGRYPIPSAFSAYRKYIEEDF